MTEQDQPTTANTTAATITPAAGPWRTNYVQPGTPYVDEETEFVPPGWYVVRAGADPEINGCDEFGSVHVQKVIDPATGDDVTEQWAQDLAAMFNADEFGFAAAKKPPRPQQRDALLGENPAAVPHILAPVDGGSSR